MCPHEAMKLHAQPRARRRSQRPGRAGDHPAARGAGKPFSLVHYLAVKSAADVMPGATIFFYFRHAPTGPWARRALALPAVRAVRVHPVQRIRGRPIAHMAHVADLLRLQVTPACNAWGRRHSGGRAGYSRGRGRGKGRGVGWGA